MKKQESISTSYTFTPSETDHDKIIYCEAYNLQSASNAVVSAKPKLYVKGNVYKFLSHDVSESDITPCNEIGKPLVVYRFSFETY